jgi:hypothetical protein
MSMRKNFNTLRNNDYATLGRRVVAEFPSVAAKLLDTPPLAQLQDLGHIEKYYLSTARPTEKKHRIKHDKVFVCLILHLYNPVVFHQPMDDMRVRMGLLKKLCEVMGYKQSHIHLMVREVVTSYKIYEDFKAQVDTAIKEVDNGG